MGTSRTPFPSNVLLSLVRRCIFVYPLIIENIFCVVSDVRYVCFVSSLFYFILRFLSLCKHAIYIEVSLLKNTLLN